MSAFEAVSFGSSLAMVVAYFCRLNMLHVREHRLDVIIFYAAGLGMVASVALHAWQGWLDVQDVCILLCCGSWIVTSYQSWKHGVPGHFKRHA